MNLAGGVAIFGPLVLHAGVLLVAGLGLAMALPVGFACAFVARGMGLSAWRYGAAGAAYTVLLFFPGVYFAARLMGWRVGTCLVGAIYLLLFGSWVLGELCWLSVLHFSSSSSPQPVADDGSGVRVALMIVFALMILVSGWQLMRRYDTDNARRLEGTSTPAQGFFLERVYLMPFAGAFISVALNTLILTEWG